MTANLMRSTLVSFAALRLVLTAAPARAHHSFEAEYDSRRTITLTGVVTKLDWINPHAYVFLDAKGEDGTVKNYRIALEKDPDNLHAKAMLEKLQ